MKHYYSPDSSEEIAAADVLIKDRADGQLIGGGLNELMAEMVCRAREEKTTEEERKKIDRSARRKRESDINRGRIRSEYLIAFYRSLISRLAKKHGIRPDQARDILAKLSPENKLKIADDIWRRSLPLAAIQMLAAMIPAIGFMAGLLIGSGVLLGASFVSFIPSTCFLGVNIFDRRSGVKTALRFCSLMWRMKKSGEKDFISQPF